MKYILIISLIISSQLRAQENVEHSLEGEVWVCFNCQVSDTSVIGKDTLNLMAYEFARYVSNLNYHAETLPKFLFNSNGDLKLGHKVEQDSLITLPDLNWKWKYAIENRNKIIIISDSNKRIFEYDLLHTDYQFRLIKIKK